MPLISFFARASCEVGLLFWCL